jgi:hypothetical protein
MVCRNRNGHKCLLALASLGFPILGLIVLSCSHSMYVREKTEFFANQREPPFKESFCVKALDVIGGISLLMPIAICCSAALAKRRKGENIGG